MAHYLIDQPLKVELNGGRFFGFQLDISDIILSDNETCGGGPQYGTYLEMYPKFRKYNLSVLQFLYEIRP